MWAHPRRLTGLREQVKGLEQVGPPRHAVVKPLAKEEVVDMGKRKRRDRRNKGLLAGAGVALVALVARARKSFRRTH